MQMRLMIEDKRMDSIESPQVQIPDEPNFLAKKKKKKNGNIVDHVSVSGKKKKGAVTRIRTWVVAATTQSTNHYTITADEEYTLFFL